MQCDKHFYNTLLSQVNKFLENEKNYISFVECSNLNYSDSYGITFRLKFKTNSGYSVIIDNERNSFCVRYENSNGENVLSNIISYNVKTSERNIVKAIKIFKLLDKKKKLWVTKWTDQREITNIDANNNITVICSNDFEKFKKRKKISLLRKIFLFIGKTGKL